MIHVGGERPKPFEEEEERSEFDEVLKRRKLKGEDQILDDGEEPKGQPVEVDNHHQYYEGDSEDEREHVFMSRNLIVENASGSESGVVDTTPSYPDEKTEALSCLDFDFCNKYRHAKKFYGMRLFELFKVQIIKLKNNDDGGDSSLEGPLRGAIEFDTHDHPELISYYDGSVSLKLEPGKIFNLPLSGPRPGYIPNTNYSGLVRITFDFVFKDDKYVLKKSAVFEPDRMSWYRDWKYSPAIERRLFGNPNTDPFILSPCFAVYYGALATLSLKILKENVSSCCGFVFARPCIFISRIRLLSLQKDERRELELDQYGSGSGSVKLTRSIVAIPCYSSLVIAAVLYDQDGKEIGRGRTSFLAKSEGTDSSVIGDNGNIQIGVSWECNNPYL